MRRILNKKTVLIVSAILIFTVVAGSTLAYVFSKTDSIENTFNPSKVSSAVVVNGGEPTTAQIKAFTSDEVTVQIKNTGDTEAYIRVAIVANWTTADGSRVWAKTPVYGTDYSVDLSNILILNNWVLPDISGGLNGMIIYYKSSVAPQTLTEALPKITATGAPIEFNGTTYYLSVEFVASAIQSTPSSTVVSEWGVTLGSDNKITGIGGGV